MRKEFWENEKEGEVGVGRAAVRLRPRRNSVSVIPVFEHEPEPFSVLGTGPKLAQFSVPAQQPFSLRSDARSPADAPPPPPPLPPFRNWFELVSLPIRGRFNILWTRHGINLQWRLLLMHACKQQHVCSRTSLIVS